jgi:hypothetical protein
MEGLSATSLFYFCDCFPPSSQVVILRLAVATVEAGGAGELQVGAVNRCLFVAVVPAHPPPPPPPPKPPPPPHLPTPFRSAVAMGYQGGCHGLPDQGRLARYLPPSLRHWPSSPRGRRRERACAGRGAGSAQQPPGAAANRLPSAQREAQRGGWGAQP